MEPTIDPSSSTDQAPPPPLKNPKHRHISRSAAKRESVQLLGSIKDLQLHFSRVGVEHRAGAGAGIRIPSGLGVVGEEKEGDEENRPPSSASASSGPSGGAASRRDRRPWKEVDLPRVDPEQAKIEIREVLRTVREAWGLGIASTGGLPRSPTTPRLPTNDTRELLIVTASSIRRVRSLALALSHTMNRKVSPSTFPRVSKGRSSISTPSRPGSTLSLPRGLSYGAGPAAERKSGLETASGPSIVVGGMGQDSLSELRKTALEVLAGLRALEERLRISRDHPLSNISSPQDPARALSPIGTSTGSSDGRPTSSMSSSATGIYDEPEGLSDDEEYNLNALAAAEGEMNKHLQTWEERIVAEAREYRALENEKGEGGAEREFVRRWCGVVDRWFLNEDGALGAADKWAEGDWAGQSLERAHEFLWAHLPLNLQLMLPPTSSDEFRTALLSRLSDGYILTQAFNAAVTSSSKVWGVIPAEDIHDTISGVAGTSSPEKDERSKEWTFRRVGNLTCWAAAIRHRYNLPIVLPNAPSSSGIPSLPTTSGPTPTLHPQSRKSSNETLPPMIRPLPIGPSSVAPPSIWKKDVERIEFDPNVIAKKGERWEGMLEAVLLKWVEEAVAERRAEDKPERSKAPI